MLAVIINHHLQMPRRARLVVPNIPLHIIQRGNNRQACFYSDDDYLFYLDWLLEYSQKTGCLIHAYVLMTNHVHLLLTPSDKKSAGDLMKRPRRKEGQTTINFHSWPILSWPASNYSPIIFSSDSLNSL